MLRPQAGGAQLCLEVGPDVGAPSLGLGEQVKVEPVPDGGFDDVGEHIRRQGLRLHDARVFGISW